MNKIYPDKLKAGDTVRFITPAQSLKIISPKCRQIAEKRFQELGLKISFGKHVKDCDDFLSSSIQSRLEDLHDAFADKNVRAIFTVIGGFNCNQLLDYIDWDLIKNNPKIFCGYSDITALNNAIYSKTGLLTYSGAHYSTLGQKLHFDYTLDYFKKCLFSSDPFDIVASKQWSDDRWYANQNDRHLIDNEGYWLINQGEAKGTIIGGNLCTLNLLQGTQYMPSLTDSILFIEDDGTSKSHDFDRNLQSLIHLPEFKGVKGLVIGRFQKVSEVSRHILEQIIKTKKELNSLPVVANVDFGHTDPKICFPIGGTASLSLSQKLIKINIINH